MESLNRTGRLCYGICIAVLGFQQIFYGSFLAVILPPWPIAVTELSPLAYFTGAILLASGIALIFEKNVRQVSLSLGAIFLIIFIFWQVPYMVAINPYTKHLGVWTNTLKLLALAGGGFIMAASFRESAEQSMIFRGLNKIVPSGKILFSVMLIAFGIDHFLYATTVAELVPEWIPGHLFWTYFSAIALIGSGVAIVLNISSRRVTFLLGIMIFLWFLILHLPMAVRDPWSQTGNSVTSAAEALGFSGIAFMLAHGLFPRVSHAQIGDHQTVKTA